MEKRTLVNVLRAEKEGKISGGIYHKLQVEFTYNSNHIEGSSLTKNQTRYIFDTNTINAEKNLNVNDIVETINHFRCIDSVIDDFEKPLTEDYTKNLHYLLKNGTNDSRLDWFAVGDYKKIPNEVGGNVTTAPEDVPKKMQKLLTNYRKDRDITFEDLLEFHYQFESIHPFQDGNGRVGRLILLKECLKNSIVPFVIDEDLKLFYYRGLHEWETEKGYLTDTCLAAQDKFKEYLDYFQIEYR